MYGKRLFIIAKRFRAIIPIVYISNVHLYFRTLLELFLFHISKHIYMLLKLKTGYSIQNEQI